MFINSIEEALEGLRAYRSSLPIEKVKIKGIWKRVQKERKVFARIKALLLRHNPCGVGLTHNIRLQCHRIIQG